MRSRARAVPVVVVAVVFAALIVFAVVVRSIGATTVPQSVQTVEVAAGDTLTSIARAAAPDAPVTAVVDRIIALNGLDGAALRAGQSLQVPAAHR